MSYLKKGEKLLLIIGPSGVGKSIVLKKLAAEGLIEIIPTWTTRPERVDEKVEKINHIFVTDKQFDKLVRKEFFLEVVTPFGLPFRYGVPKINKLDKTKIPAGVLRAPFVNLVQKHYPNYIVYQIEDTLNRVKERLALREGFGESMGSRLKEYSKEVKLGRKLAKRAFMNKDIELLVSQVKIALAKDFKC